MFYRIKGVAPREYRRDVNIEKTRRHVVETITASKKLDIIGVTIGRIDRELVSLDRGLDRSRAHIQNLTGHPGTELGADIESRGNVALGTTLLVSGVGVQWMVMRSALSDFGPLVIGGSAVAFDAGITALGYGILRSINDHVRPAATLRIGKILSLIATGLVFLTGSIAAYARFTSASTSERFFALAAASLWLLAEALPLSAGLWFGLAHIRSYPQRVATEIDELEQRRLQLVAFRAELLHERTLIAPKPEHETRSTTAASSANGFVRTSDERTDQTSPLPDPASASASARSAVRAAGVLVVTLTASVAQAQIPCGLAIERGLIGEPTARREATEHVLARLEEFVAVQRCVSVIVSTFTDAGAFSRRVALVVPARAPRRDCATAAPVKDIGMQNVLEPFAGYREHRRKQAEDACRAELARSDSAFNAAQDRFRRELRRLTDQGQILTPARNDIAGVLKGFSESGVRDVLAVTSGIDTSDGVPDQLPSDMRAWLVVYEAREAYGGRSATDASTERWRRAGAIVIPFTHLTPGIWVRLQATKPQK